MPQLGLPKTNSRLPLMKPRSAKVGKKQPSWLDTFQLLQLSYKSPPSFSPSTLINWVLSTHPLAEIGFLSANQSYPSAFFVCVPWPSWWRVEEVSLDSNNLSCSELLTIGLSHSSRAYPSSARRVLTLSPLPPAHPPNTTTSFLPPSRSSRLFRWW